MFQKPETDGVQAVVLEKDGEKWLERFPFEYDEESSWYTILSSYEPVMCGEPGNCETWGSHVYQKISKLQYMNQFYRQYSDVEITPQFDAQIKSIITPQTGAQIDKNIIFMVPWSHHKVIMDKCKEDQQRALFFVQNDRQGKAVTNFEYTLPPARSDLAQELTKDPYNFDFITLPTIEEIEVELYEHK